MFNLRTATIVSLGFLLGGQLVVAEAPFRYREYALESSVASVVKTSGARIGYEDASREAGKDPGARMARAVRAVGQ